MTQTWSDGIRTTVAEMVKNGEIEPLNAAVLLGKADFADSRNVTGVIGYEANLWGFGRVRVLFEDPNGGFWCRLDDLVEPTGVDYTGLLEEFASDIEDPGDGKPNVDVLAWTRPDGERIEIPMANNTFAFNVMSSRSPWSAEFQAAMFDVFRRAAVASGLADALTVVQVAPDGQGVGAGTSLRDVIAPDGKLPSEEAARSRAFAGPVLDVGAL